MSYANTELVVRIMHNDFALLFRLACFLVVILQQRLR